MGFDILPFRVEIQRYLAAGERDVQRLAIWHRFIGNVCFPGILNRAADMSDKDATQ
jgi:hypothetical protein